MITTIHVLSGFKVRLLFPMSFGWRQALAALAVGGLAVLASPVIEAGSVELPDNYYSKGRGVLPDGELEILLAAQTIGPDDWSRLARIVKNSSPGRMNDVQGNIVRTSDPSGDQRSLTLLFKLKEQLAEQRALISRRMEDVVSRFEPGSKENLPAFRLFLTLLMDGPITETIRLAQLLPVIMTYDIPDARVAAVCSIDFLNSKQMLASPDTGVPQREILAELVRSYEGTRQKLTWDCLDEIGSKRDLILRTRSEIAHKMVAEQFLSVVEGLPLPDFRNEMQRAYHSYIQDPDPRFLPEVMRVAVLASRHTNERFRQNFFGNLKVVYTALYSEKRLNQCESLRHYLKSAADGRVDADWAKRCIELLRRFDAHESVCPLNL